VLKRLGWNLLDVNFFNAIIHNANMTGANTTGAAFTGATWSKTTYSDGKHSVEQMVYAAESMGMKYVHIPMAGKKYPTPEVTEMFLKTVNDPATGKFFVHCAGGRHRTGAMGAVYRHEFYHWTFEQAYKEMKQYDFYTNWGHQSFKDFVRDYYAPQSATPKPAADAATSRDKQ